MNYFETFDRGSKKYLTAVELKNAYYRSYGETAWLGQAQAVINAQPDKKLRRENFKSSGW